MNLMEELLELKEVIYVQCTEQVSEVGGPTLKDVCLVGCPGLGILVIYLQHDGDFDYGFAPANQIDKVRVDLLASPFIPYMVKITAPLWFKRVDFAQFEDYSTFYNPKVVETIIGMFLETANEAKGRNQPSVR